MCPGGRGVYRVQVRDGHIVEATMLHSSDAREPAEIRLAPMSIDSVFSVLDRAYREPHDRIDVRYHPVLGYPLIAGVDPNAQTFDDEFFIEIGFLTSPH